MSANATTKRNQAGDPHMNYTYTLNDVFTTHEKSIVSSVKTLNDSTAPGLEWVLRGDNYELIPDFLLPISKIAGRWNKQDIESYGVSFDEFEQFINRIGYEVVYGSGT